MLATAARTCFVDGKHALLSYANEHSLRRFLTFLLDVSNPLLVARSLRQLFVVRLPTTSANIRLLLGLRADAAVPLQRRHRDNQVTDGHDKTTGSAAVAGEASDLLPPIPTVEQPSSVGPFGVSSAVPTHHCRAAIAVCAELGSTERTYLRDLRRLSECRAALPELPLSSVDALLLLHEHLATKLGVADESEDGATSQRLLPPAPPAPDGRLIRRPPPPPPPPPSARAVARAFLYMGPFLRTYADYILGQYNRLEALEQLKSRPSGLRRLQAVQGACGEPMESLLIKPVQRLCKYPLLIGALLKAMDESGAAGAHESVECEQLRTALALVEKKAAEVNAASHHAEQAAKVFELGSSWRAYVSPTRRLRYSCDVEAAGQLCRDARTSNIESKSSKEASKDAQLDGAHEASSRRAYLFSDALVLAQPQQRSLPGKVATHVTSLIGRAHGLGSATLGSNLGLGSVLGNKRRSSTGSPGAAPVDKFIPKEHFDLAEVEIFAGDGAGALEAPALLPGAERPPPSNTIVLARVEARVEGRVEGRAEAKQDAQGPPEPLPRLAKSSRATPSHAGPLLELASPQANSPHTKSSQTRSGQAKPGRAKSPPAKSALLNLVFSSAAQRDAFLEELTHALAEHAQQQSASALRARACMAQLETQRTARHYASVGSDVAGGEDAGSERVRRPAHRRGYSDPMTSS